MNDDELKQQNCARIGCLKKGTTWYYPEGSSMFVIKYWVCEEHREELTG